MSPQEPANPTPVLYFIDTGCHDNDDCDDDNSNILSATAADTQSNGNNTSAALPVPRKPVIGNGVGRILMGSPDNGLLAQSIAEGLTTPYGIAIAPAAGKMFWTSAGANDGKSPCRQKDGCVLSCDLVPASTAASTEKSAPQTRQRSGSSPFRYVVPKGEVRAPRQLCVDEVNNKLYFTDREGLRIKRCNLDGSHLETLIKTGDPRDEMHRADRTRWCVGVAVAPRTGRFFWAVQGFGRTDGGRESVASGIGQGTGLLTPPSSSVAADAVTNNTAARAAATTSPPPLSLDAPMPTMNGGTKSTTPMPTESMSDGARIYSASIDFCDGENADTRSDVECLFSDLPAGAVSLEMDDATNTLYWAGRHGVSRASLDNVGKGRITRASTAMTQDSLPSPPTFSHEVISSTDPAVSVADDSMSSGKGTIAPYESFIAHDAFAKEGGFVGIRLDVANRHLYVADRGGAIYQHDLDGGEHDSGVKVFDANGVGCAGIALTHL